MGGVSGGEWAWAVKYHPLGATTDSGENSMQRTCLLVDVEEPCRSPLSLGTIAHQPQRHECKPLLTSHLSNRTLNF